MYDDLVACSPDKNLCPSRGWLLRKYTRDMYSLSRHREAIRKNATGLATTVGAEALGTSGLVPDPPPGSDDLLLHMLYTLTGATRPQPDF